MRKQAISYDQVVALIRRSGPKTMVQVAEVLGRSTTFTAEAMRRARRDAVLKVIGKDEYGRLIIAAVQTHDWPQREAAE
jgi:hypothetical protein